MFTMHESAPTLVSSFDHPIIPNDHTVLENKPGAAGIVDFENNAAIAAHFIVAADFGCEKDSPALEVHAAVAFRIGAEAV